MIFFKEMKKTVFSITFLVFLIAAAAFVYSQDALDFSDQIFTPPRQGEDFGRHKKEVPELIMPAAYASLKDEFEENNYVAYPIGFYKNVKLKEKEQEQMAEILSMLSGVPDDKVTYEEFKACMRQADELIGGGSKYADEYLTEFSFVPVTFEEAQEQYNLAAGTDHFTGTYARCFCDYLGILLSFLPVFLSVAVCMKDRRAGMSDLVYARQTSSFKLIAVRFLAVSAAVMIPSVVLAYISNRSVWEFYDGLTLDYLAPLKYAAGWLMPSAMMAIAVGMFLTELTGTPVAIAIQGIWWFADFIGGGIIKLEGYQSLFRLTPRHNSCGNTQIFIDNFRTLAANRLLYAGEALVLVVMTVVVYEQKRRGNIHGFTKAAKHDTNLADRKGKSMA